MKAVNHILQVLFQAWVSLVANRKLKVHFVISLISITAGFFYNITSFEWVILSFAVVMVLTLAIIDSCISSDVPLLNSTILTKMKQLVPGAVFTASVVALAVGVAVFRKYCMATPDLSAQLDKLAQFMK